MFIYILYDDNKRIYAYSLYEEASYIKTFIDDNDVDGFMSNTENYIVKDGIIELNYNLIAMQNKAKEKCDNLFKVYTEHIKPKTDEEIYLNNVMRNELSVYVKDNEMPTPVFDRYAKSMGFEDLAQKRIEFWQEILHTDIALADLVAQKHKIEKFIDECKDAEMLIDFEPNFHFISYSNMRWS